MFALFCLVSEVNEKHNVYRQFFTDIVYTWLYDEEKLQSKIVSWLEHKLA